MAYTLSTVRSRIEQKLDDTSFGTSKLTQFINDGQADILNSRRFTFMEREADIVTNPGDDTTLNVPALMQTPLSLRVYTPTSNALYLPYMEYENIDKMYPNIMETVAGAPVAWRAFNQDIFVYPIADNSYAMKLRYIKAPAELVLDDDVPEVPEPFGETLVLAGYKRALEHNDDYDQAQVIQQQIDVLIEKMDERYKRQTGRPHIMQQPLRRNRVRGF